MEIAPEPRSRLPVITLALLALVSILAFLEGYQLYESSTLNNLIKHPELIKDDTPYPAKVLFAKAYYLEKQGKPLEALRVYSQISTDSDPIIQEQVQYNMATIYLKEGAKQWNEKGVWAYSQVLTMVQLAEESYRDVLQQNSRNRAARYNLEYTLRIQPPPKEVDNADWQGRRSSVHSVLPGRPSGGP